MRLHPHGGRIGPAPETDFRGRIISFRTVIQYRAMLPSRGLKLPEREADAPMEEQRIMTIRLLSSSDRDSVESLCGRTPEQDLFLLANLDLLTSNQDLVQYFGQFDTCGSLSAVLMRYHVLWYWHAETHEQISQFARVIDRQRQPKIILNGGPKTVSELEALLPNYQTQMSLPGRLRRLQAIDAPTQVDLVGLPNTGRRATLDDLESLTKFYASATEDVRRGSESLRRSVTGGRRMFVVEQGGELTAGALTTAELPHVAMIGGLHAADASHLFAAVKGLLTSLQTEGKNACVVTRDTGIDEVLDVLGFKDISSWQILHMDRRVAEFPPLGRHRTALTTTGV